jgi:hypothetical protein
MARKVPKSGSCNDEVSKSRDARLLTALLEGKTVRDAAAAAGMSAKTAHRRLQDTEFKARLSEIRSEVFCQVVLAITGLMKKATDRLGRMLGSDRDTAAAAAIKIVFDQYGKVGETQNVRDQIDQIKAMVRQVQAERAATIAEPPSWPTAEHPEERPDGETRGYNGEPLEPEPAGEPDTDLAGEADTSSELWPESQAC